MRLTYDPEANVAYIRLRERQGDVETIELTADVLVDIDATGAVCGIELLDANEQLTAGDDGIAGPYAQIRSSGGHIDQSMDVCVMASSAYGRGCGSGKKHAGEAKGWQSENPPVR